MATAGGITALIRDYREGNRDALDELLLRLYPELRAIAGKLHRRFPLSDVSQPTSLAHDAILRLFYGNPACPENRTHLLALAARQMRFLLIDATRRVRRRKEVPVSADLGAAPDVREYPLAINSALERLRGVDPRAATVVELSFFGGLSLVEIADRLSLSVRTVKRDWDSARAWLHGELRSAYDPQN